MERTLNENVIAWAAERSGLTDERLHRAFPKLNEWLDGSRKPTVNQLKALAKKLNIQLFELFGEHLPDYALQIPDFRTFEDSGVKEPSPSLYDTVELMVRRQSWMRDFFLSEGYERVGIVGSFQRSSSVDGPRELARELYGWLGLEDDWAIHLRTYDEALRRLKDTIEGRGISVAINGVVGDCTNRPLDIDEFRGFALADDVAPLIFINGRDTKGAQIFTLVHELSHLALNQTGLSNPVEDELGSTDIERFCNATAAEFLVPNGLLMQEWHDADCACYDRVEHIARLHKVSFMVVARRLHDEGELADPDFFALCHRHRAEANKVVRGKGSGGDYYRTKRNKLGNVFSEAILSAVTSGAITYRDAYELTNMKGSTFSKYYEGVA